MEGLRQRYGKNKNEEIPLFDRRTTLPNYDSATFQMEIDDSEIHPPMSRMQNIQKHFRQNKGKYILGGAAATAATGIGVIGDIIVNTTSDLSMTPEQWYVKTADEFQEGKANEKGYRDNVDPRLALKMHKNDPIQYTQEWVNENLADVYFRNNYMSEEYHIKDNSNILNDNLDISTRQDLVKQSSIAKTNEGHSGWLRNYPHMGPGNKILSNSKNPLDEIARTHDLMYSLARTPDDIYKADKQFIDLISTIDSTTWSDTILKYIAKFSIQSKTYLEQKINKIIYPPGIAHGKLNSKYKPFAHV